MDNLTVWLILGIASIIFAIFSRVAAHNERSMSWWFFEGWRDFVGYFVAGVVGYFFTTIRFPNIIQSGNLSSWDFFLLVIFIISILGWLPYFIKNMTEGLNALIERLLKK